MEKLVLSRLDNLEMIWDYQLFSLDKLEYLEISECANLKYLFGVKMVEENETCATNVCIYPIFTSYHMSVNTLKLKVFKMCLLY